MIVSNSTKNKKIEELNDKHSTEHSFNYRKFAKEYAKWYAKKVIDRCAEVAELDYAEDEGQSTSIDKQSILRVKEEL